VTIIEYSQITN